MRQLTLIILCMGGFLTVGAAPSRAGFFGYYPGQTCCYGGYSTYYAPVTSYYYTSYYAPIRSCCPTTACYSCPSSCCNDCCSTASCCGTSCCPTGCVGGCTSGTCSAAGCTNCAASEPATYSASRPSAPMRTAARPPQPEPTPHTTHLVSTHAEAAGWERVVQPATLRQQTSQSEQPSSGWEPVR